MAACALLAVALAGAGCGEQRKSSEDSVREVWSGMQRGTRISRDRVSIVAAGGRQIICYALAPSLRRQLATAAGQPQDFLPRCLFLRRVPMLDGSRTLGDLRGLRFVDGGNRAIANFALRTGAKSRIVTVTFGKLNQSNWVVTSIRTLRAIPVGQPLEPGHPRATITTPPPPSE